jgi:hypothetical protein
LPFARELGDELSPQAARLFESVSSGLCSSFPAIQAPEITVVFRDLTFVIACDDERLGVALAQHFATSGEVTHPGSRHPQRVEVRSSGLPEGDVVVASSLRTLALRSDDPDKVFFCVQDEQTRRILAGSWTGFEIPDTSDQVEARHALLSAVIEHELLCHISLEYQDLLFVHGACVTHEGWGVILLGPSGSGKTTLAASLALRGAAIAADDVCAVRDAQVYGFPAVARLRAGAATLLFAACPSASQSAIRDILIPDDTHARRGALISAFVVLAEHAAPLQSLSSADAFDAVMTNRLNFGELALDRVCRDMVSLVQSVPGFRLGRGDLRCCTNDLWELLTRPLRAGRS